MREEFCKRGKDMNDKFINFYVSPETSMNGLDQEIKFWENQIDDD